LVVAGLWEYSQLARARRRIPIRIHVNGTRGKSSVTRLLAAALAEAGIPTFAKTTGTQPRMIFPDGRELPVFRPANANIIEQEKILRIAAASEAQAIVIECMALQPLLQSVSELKIIQSTHTLITNARPDHLDVMGPTARDVATALAGMLSVGGKVFTCESDNVDVLLEACEDRGSVLVRVDSAGVDAVSADELAQFRYTEHAENVALVLSICADFGISRQVALAGMFRALPDPGAMTAHHLDGFGRSLVFYNGFAANDPVSTGQVWRLACDQQAARPTKIAIFNCRSDRPERSAQLAEALATWPSPDWIVLMGTDTQLFARQASRAGVDMKTLVSVEGQRVEEIFERLVEISGRSAMLMGMGNIGGSGLDLAQLFKDRAAHQEPS
jgi:poly-gamma-glutamate synthase PgsB/CapB